MIHVHQKSGRGANAFFLFVCSLEMLTFLQLTRSHLWRTGLGFHASFERLGRGSYFHLTSLLSCE